MDKFVLTALIIITKFGYSQMRPDWQFREELMNQLISPADTIYIQNRHHLEKFAGLKSTDSSASIDYKSRAGDKIFISISTRKFDPSKHKLDLADTVYKFIHNEKRVDYLISKNLIDGKPAYGIDADIPRTEIRSLKIKYNNKWLVIPKEIIVNFFEVHPESLEAYLSKNGRLIYLYLSASDGIGSYSIKFVFDRTKYVTRLIGMNECTDQFDFLDALPKECGE